MPNVRFGGIRYSGSGLLTTKQYREIKDEIVDRYKDQLDDMKNDIMQDFAEKHADILDSFQDDMAYNAALLYIAAMIDLKLSYEFVEKVIDKAADYQEMINKDQNYVTKLSKKIHNFGLELVKIDQEGGDGK